MTKKEREIIQKLINDAEENRSYFPRTDSGSRHAVSFISGRIHAYNEIITTLGGKNEKENSKKMA